MKPLSLSAIETDSQALDYRIYVHERFSKSDFDAWALDRLALKEGMRALDAGCGTGKHLFEIAKRVGSRGAVVGTDTSRQSLDRCREKIRDEKAKNIFVFEADLTEIPEKVERSGFDRILSSFAIYYTKNPQKTFHDLYAVLKPGGLFFMCGPTEQNNLEFLELVRLAGGAFSKDFLRWSSFLERDARAIVQELFQEVNVEYFNNPVEFPDAETLFKYWQATALYDASTESNMRNLISQRFKEKRTFVSNKVIIGITCKKTL